MVSSLNSIELAQLTKELEESKVELVTNEKLYYELEKISIQRNQNLSKTSQNMQKCFSSTNTSVMCNKQIGHSSKSYTEMRLSSLNDQKKSFIQLEQEIRQFRMYSSLIKNLNTNTKAKANFLYSLQQQNLLLSKPKTEVTKQ